MDSVLAAAYQRAIWDRLSYLDRLVSQADQSSLLRLAPGELTTMARAWRELLRAHVPDEEGRCPQCSAWRRARTFPCPVWESAHHSFVADRR